MTNDLEKLREEIAATIVQAYYDAPGDEIDQFYIADRILALPQIADLLRMKAIQVVC